MNLRSLATGVDPSFNANRRTQLWPQSPVEGEATPGFAAGEDGSPEPIPPSEVGVMIWERVTAWTLVVLYYCVGCGVILLGLRGAL